MTSEIEYEFYELTRITVTKPKPGEFRLVTAAFMFCATCGRPIASMGGPGDGYICIPCGDVIKAEQARGCIKWDEA